MLYFGITDLLQKPSEPTAFSLNVFAAIAGLFLFTGLWTPVTGTLAAIAEACIAWSSSPSGLTYVGIHVVLAILSTSVAMLGPGAWSLDALFFGRKRFDIGPSTGRSGDSRRRPQ